MSGAVNVVLLCEDKLLSACARRFLEHRRFKISEVPRPPKNAGGSRKQWITEEYPRQMKVVRQRQEVALIVCTDADELTVGERIAELDKACEKAGIDPRKPEEKILMVVPKWHIETWLSYLDGNSVDEEKRLPHSYNGQEKKCKDPVNALVEMCTKRQILQEPAPPSLKAACEEYKKL
jgi:hypothetical protein